MDSHPSAPPSRFRARRVAVKGASGAGKSTLGRQLALHLGVPYIELDALHHGPNWTPAEPAELQAKVLAALDGVQGWVVDGNYDSKLGSLVIDRADVVIWLDLPLHTKLARLIRRTARRYFQQQELWNGNRETLKGALWGREALLPWAIRAHFRHRREWPARFGDRQLVRLRSAREVEAWLAELQLRDAGEPGAAGAPAPGSSRRAVPS